MTRPRRPVARQDPLCALEIAISSHIAMFSGQVKATRSTASAGALWPDQSRQIEQGVDDHRRQQTAAAPPQLAGGEAQRHGGEGNGAAAVEVDDAEQGRRDQDPGR